MASRYTNEEEAIKAQCRAWPVRSRSWHGPAGLGGDREYWELIADISEGEDMKVA